MFRVMSSSNITHCLGHEAQFSYLTKLRIPIVRAFKYFHTVDIHKNF